MIGTTTKPKIKYEIKVERPREFVVIVLKVVFHLSDDQA
jgi:hypothetical protein